MIEPDVREYVFQGGGIPTRAEARFPILARNFETTRETFRREDSKWVVRYTTTQVDSQS